MFFLLKLNSLNVDRCVLQLFYKALQSMLSFNMCLVTCNQDQDRLQCMIMTVSRITGCDQMSAAQSDESEAHP